jgi:uncharacterized protein DUF6950
VTRFPDWQARLSQFLYLYRNRSFRYGDWDCCLFAADAIQVMTGADLAEGFRGTYNSRSTAYALLKANFGGPSVRAFAQYAAAKHGMEQVAISYGRRGDMALIRRARDYSLGIISMTGKEIVVLRARTLMTIPLSYGLLAWHV